MWNCWASSAAFSEAALLNLLCLSCYSFVLSGFDWWGTTGGSRVATVLVFLRGPISCHFEPTRSWVGSRYDFRSQRDLKKIFKDKAFKFTYVFTKVTDGRILRQIKESWPAPSPPQRKISRHPVIQPRQHGCGVDVYLDWIWEVSIFLHEIEEIWAGVWEVSLAMEVMDPKSSTRLEVICTGTWKTRACNAEPVFDGDFLKR
jgi:hypothetical protein